MQEAKGTVATNAEATDATAVDVQDTAAENEQQDEDAENAGQEDKPEKSGKKPRGRPFRFNRNNRTVFHQPENSDPSCRVYVGNLAWEVTWMDLKDHMKQGGCEVTRADILATPDGRSKGCGIVEFASTEGAQRALLLNDTELKGRQIFVREDRESGGGGGYFTQKPSAGVSKGRVSGGEKQSCRVYVGNLSWEVAWQDLKDHMRGAGEVVYAEVMTEPDGRSKGCGIVEYSSPEEAQKACETLNDTELQGRMIFVREDRETASSGGAGGGQGRPRGGYRGGTSVYVGNLAYETSWQDLKDHMRQAGNVDQANIMKQDDGRSKGCGIVVYQNPRDAARAIRELQNSELHGRPIFVREDREQQGGGRRGGGGFHRSSGAGGAATASGGGGGGAANGCQLYVGNLSFDTTWKELKDHFRQCGEVERVEVMEGPGGRKKGFGTVRFFNAKDAKNAIERLDGVELQGRELKVRLDEKAG